MLQLNSISFDYADTPLLNQIEFQVPAGSILHLQGENGSGKSTLLKLIAGLFQPSEGSIFFQGEPIQHVIHSYQKNLCYIGHKMGMSSTLTIRQNAYFDLQNIHQDMDWAHCIDCFSLTGLEDIPCGRLSAGQRRRVTLFKLLMSKAPLWLLDEPFNAMDTKAVSFLVGQILGHVMRGGSVIYTSHQSIAFPDEIHHGYQL